MTLLRQIEVSMAQGKSTPEACRAAEISQQSYYRWYKKSVRPIERWHQTLKNRILLENYYLPGDLKAQIGRFIEYYNHQRYHESLDNLTPADVYFGRGRAILQERHRIKQKTIEQRRLLHRKLAA